MWSASLCVLNPYQALANHKPKIIDCDPESKKSAFVFGYATCPNCTCRNPVNRRMGGIKPKRCLCCRRLFVIKDSCFDRA